MSILTTFLLSLALVYYIGILFGSKIQGFRRHFWPWFSLEETAWNQNFTPCRLAILSSNLWISWHISKLHCHFMQQRKEWGENRIKRASFCDEWAWQRSSHRGSKISQVRNPRPPLPVEKMGGARTILAPPPQFGSTCFVRLPRWHHKFRSIVVVESTNVNNEGRGGQPFRLYDSPLDTEKQNAQASVRDLSFRWHWNHFCIHNNLHHKEACWTLIKMDLALPTGMFLCIQISSEV